jgi:hypothetical protein
MVLVGDVDSGVKSCDRLAPDETYTRSCDAGDQANLMVAEKMAVAFEAVETLLTGGDFSIVVDRYREHVTANATRLIG